MMGGRCESGAAGASMVKDALQTFRIPSCAMRTILWHHRSPFAPCFAIVIDTAQVRVVLLSEVQVLHREQRLFALVQGCAQLEA